MTDPGAAIAALLSDAALADTPVPLTGGRSAEIYRFRLDDGPSDLGSRDLVLRVMPSRATSVAEAVIQAEVERQGFPTPTVHAHGIVDNRFCSVMDHVEGRTLFDADRMGALRRVPEQLADLMISLHSLDTKPVRVALADAAADTVDSVARTFAEIDAHPDDEQLRALRRWLEANRPAIRPQVICHNDLHALNVLVAPSDSASAVIDWELATLGEPASDVARTVLLMMAVPMDLPRVVRPLIERVGRRSAGRFEDRYRSGADLDQIDLDWYLVFHATRIIAMVAADESNASPDLVVDGWRPALPLLRRIIEARSGIALSRR